MNDELQNYYFENDGGNFDGKTKEELVKELRSEKRINAVRGLFANMVAHDLRNPLSIIRGAAEIAEMAVEAGDKVELIDQIGAIMEATSHMIRTIDDILFFAKAQNDQLEFNPIPIDVIGVCAGIISDLERLNGGRKVVMQVSKNFRRKLYIDETLFSHIVSNLLSNAIKYSAETVHLSLASDGEELTITVEDSGIGIPSGEVGNIFNPFARCSNSGKGRGVGIGMFIIKRCLEICGGTIAVSSKENVGTIFRVKIPLKQVSVC
jgi:signal transduction histidine kinase